jgi:hypothetical protein
MDWKEQMMNKLLESGKVTVGYGSFEKLVEEMEYVGNVDFDIEIRGIRVTIKAVES